MDLETVAQWILCGGGSTDAEFKAEKVSLRQRAQRSDNQRRRDASEKCAAAVPPPPHVVRDQTSWAGPGSQPGGASGWIGATLRIHAGGDLADGEAQRGRQRSL